MVNHNNPMHELDELEAPTLEMRNHKYIPGILKVQPGSIIKLVNNDSDEHTVTATNGAFDEEVLAGNISELIAPSPGSYNFYCRYHSEMEGTLIVE